MKNLFFRVLVGITGMTFLPVGIFAADIAPLDAKIDHFVIIAPPTVRVGEAMDVTIEARDKDDKLMMNYRGSIFFQSDTDFGATLPAQGKAISFKESDNGILKISKGVTFKRIGNQQLAVTEAREDATGMITIRVEEGAATIGTPTVESISITTPEKDATLTSDTYMMSGKTKKNSKVIIKLNGNELGTTQSNDDGIYTFQITGITQQANILAASVFDGANTMIGTIETSFKYGLQAPTYYSIVIAPSTELEAGTGISLLVDAEPSLSEVTATIDGTIIPLKEASPGKYRAESISPAKPGTYPVQVTLKNLISQITTKPDAANITVKAAAEVVPVVETPIALFKNVRLTSEGNRVNMNFFVENLPADTIKFKIAYGENADSLSNDVMTFPLEKIKREDGSYNWYIDKLDAKSYSFKIFAVQSGETINPTLASEVLSATIGKGACTIGNIGDIMITTMDNKTILSWDMLTGAISYNVYKLSAAKDYELISNVKDASYTLYLSSGALAYNDFAVKALCDDSTESNTPAIASRVQTGPGFISLLVILSSILSIIFIRKRRA